MGRPRKEVDLLPIFRGARVVTLEQLETRLELSRSTVLRRLAEHGYRASYNHSGSFLCIDEVADFDSRGLWTWKEARFSKLGTLKQTVTHFVEASERGMTHEELATLLGVRVHNTLLELVEARKVSREKLGVRFVYLSSRRRVHAEQARSRRAFLREHRKPRPTNPQIIATLLELIRAPKAPRDEIVLRLKRKGVPISRDVVDAIFETFDLDKKRAL